MGWICKECGTENELSQKTCEVCNTPIDSEQYREAARGAFVERFKVPLFLAAKFSPKVPRGLFYLSIICVLLGASYTIVGGRFNLLMDLLIHIFNRFVTVFYNVSSGFWYSSIGWFIQRIAMNSLRLFDVFKAVFINAFDQVFHQAGDILIYDADPLKRLIQVYNNVVNAADRIVENLFSFIDLIFSNI
jgi:hypothetical protein